jgi:hypothetical protein
MLISVAFAATIVIVSCFAPEQDCAGLAIGAIGVAELEILVNAYAFTTEMREFLGNLHKEISIENSQKLVTYRYRRAEDRKSKLVLVDLAMHRDAARRSGIPPALNRGMPPASMSASSPIVVRRAISGRR